MCFLSSLENPGVIRSRVAKVQIDLCMHCKNKVKEISSHDYLIWPRVPSNPLLFLNGNLPTDANFKFWPVTQNHAMVANITSDRPCIGEGPLSPLGLLLNG